MSRSHYWSCSKFADWVRGTPKLGAGTAEQWDEWDSKAKRYNPIRYWLAEEGLDYVSNIVYFIPDTLYSIKYYINNRWVTRTHSLTAHPRDIKPGQWQDVGNRFLPCLFNELVDFVEIEQAWSHIAWGSEEDKAKYKAPFWASGWFRWRVWRCPQAGIDHLDWAMTLVMDDNMGVEKDSPNYGKPTGQAERAKEIKDLYTWWTVTRPARLDPYEASGWTAVCEASRLANGGKFNWSGREKDPVLKKQSDKAHKLLQKMETAYEKEDEDMMIRLIKARDSLWT
jgi:hypothetical protein